MKKLIFILMIGIFLLTFVSAGDEHVFQQSSNVDLKVPCVIDDEYCSLSSSCNLTVLDPNGNNIINNSLMTPSTNYHNYTLNTSDTSVNGEYTRNVQCCDGALCGYGTDTFTVTPTGSKLTTASSIGYGIILIIMFAVCVFFLVFSKMTENPGIKLFFLMVGFGVVLLTIGTGMVVAQNFDIQSNATILVSGLMFLITMVFILVMYYIFIQQTRRAIQLMKARKGFIDEEDLNF